jgi:hypothetical protein
MKQNSLLLYTKQANAARKLRANFTILVLVNSGPGGTIIEQVTYLHTGKKNFAKFSGASPTILTHHSERIRV